MAKRVTYYHFSPSYNVPSILMEGLLTERSRFGVVWLSDKPVVVSNWARGESLLGNFGYTHLAVSLPANWPLIEGFLGRDFAQHVRNLKEPFKTVVSLKDIPPKFITVLEKEWTP